MKTVFNPIYHQGEFHSEYFDEKDMIDFYGYAQEHVFSSSIVIIPAPKSNPELTKKLKDAFINANLDYDKMVYDYETRKEEEQWCGGLTDEEVDPLFKRGSMSLPIVVLGHKYAVDAEEVITALKYQKHKNILVMYDVDWTEVYAIEDWSRTLIEKRTSAANFFHTGPSFPMPFELEEEDDLGLDPDEWDNPDQLDDDEPAREAPFYIRQGYRVMRDITPVENEAPWWSHAPVIVHHSDTIPF